jgi:FixJ family two-component response regulator
MNGLQNIYIGIVDDDESVCRSLGRFLRAARVQPITYPSAEALLADTKHPKFDCLVLDVQLGGMSGLELSRHLIAEKDTTPVIFITAHDDPAAKAEAEANGCRGYFRKTDSGKDVLAAIHRAIGMDACGAAVEATIENHPGPQRPSQTRG